MGTNKDENVTSLHNNKNKDNPNQTHDEVNLNKKEDCPFVIRASKFNHKISLFKRQKTSNF
jgi:hypothetical protein